MLKYLLYITLCYAFVFICASSLPFVLFYSLQHTIFLFEVAAHSITLQWWDTVLVHLPLTISIALGTSEKLFRNSLLWSGHLLTDCVMWCTQDLYTGAECIINMIIFILLSSYVEHCSQIINNIGVPCLPTFEQKLKTEKIDLFSKVLLSCALAMIISLFTQCSCWFIAFHSTVHTLLTVLPQWIHSPR